MTMNMLISGCTDFQLGEPWRSEALELASTRGWESLPEIITKIEHRISTDAQRGGYTILSGEYLRREDRALLNALKLARRRLCDVNLERWVPGGHARAVMDLLGPALDDALAVLDWLAKTERNSKRRERRALAGGAQHEQDWLYSCEVAGVVCDVLAESGLKPRGTTAAKLVEIFLDATGCEQPACETGTTETEQRLRARLHRLLKGYAEIRRLQADREHRMLSPATERR